MKGKLSKQIFASILKISGLVLLACLVLGGGIFYYGYNHRIQQELYKQALYLSYTINGKKPGEIQKLPENKDRVTLLDRNGRVLYDNQVDPSHLKSHYDRPEFQKALKEGFGFVRRFSTTMDKQTINYAYKMPDGRVLRVSKQVDSLFNPFLQGIIPLAIVLGFLLLLTSLAAKQLVQEIVRPINHIDLDHPTDQALYEEIWPLVQRISMQNKALDRTLAREREKQEEFQWMVDHMSEGLLLVDDKERIVSYNNSALYLLEGHKVRRGEHFRNMRVDPGLEMDIRSGLKGHRSRKIFKKENGSYEINIHPIAQNDRISGVVVLVLDVTQREELEQYRREFTANVSHELKTPLTSIMGFGELLGQGLVKDQDIHRVGNRIESEAKRLMDLVSDLLKLSQIEEGGDIFKKGCFSPQEVIQSVLDHLKEIAEKKDIQLIFSGESSTLVGQKKLFYEMVYNLVDNGIKYAKGPGYVQVDLEEDLNSIQLWVKDNGPGIEPEDQPRIFERFYRGDKSHSSEIKGTGLGLSIVKHAVKVFEGTIDLKSSSSGTTFHMEFPKTR